MSPVSGTKPPTADPNSGRTADRLLRSAADKFYDPDVDIDWNAPDVPGKVFHPEHRISLYGTELWDRMSPEQRVELGRHEIASIASAGIFFEILLMQILLKHVYKHDPTSPKVQFSLTEIADECRHSTMFAKAITRWNMPYYGPPRWLRSLAKIFPAIAGGPSSYAAILVAEEITDRMQRENMADENLQPLIRMVNRIHVLEEARHVSFAREEIMAGMARAGRFERAWHRLMTGVVSYFVAYSLVNAKVYEAVGLDPREARRAARNNPAYQETLLFWSEKVMKFLAEADLLGGPAMILWRRAGFVPK
jgi:hypothetical protein